MGVHQEPALQNGVSISTPTSEAGESQLLQVSVPHSALHFVSGLLPGAQEEGKLLDTRVLPSLWLIWQFLWQPARPLISPYPTWALPWFPPELC